MQIGKHKIKNKLVVAPMAGVTDRPFRQLCKQMGAGMAVSEMVASNSLLWGSEKTRRRANHDGEVDPISVQIAGADPQMLRKSLTSTWAARRRRYATSWRARRC
jgi:tRNA-dihydrouridine synthase B